jgi:hypothetical protein
MHAAVPARGRAAFWALVALTGATRLAIVLADHRSLIANDVYPDDAFYYLRVAANVVEGRGWTFDGLAPTNGFHPLYMLMVMPIMALSRGDLVLPIHLTGVLLTAWAMGTGVVLHALLARTAGRRTALFGLFVWAVSPFFVLMSINGLETGVAMFFVLLILWLYLSWFRGDWPPGARQALIFGAACGLATLARIDLLLLVAALALDWLVRQARARERSWALGALVAAAAAAVWLPWGLVSHAVTGHWLPTSGSASRLVALNFGWLNMRPIWPALTEQTRLFDPAHVPAAYHADVGTKMVFVFALENPLLAWLRANVPAGAWADLDGFVPYELFCRNPPAATAIVSATTIALLLWRRRARARQDAVPEGPRPLPRLVLGGYLALVALGYTFYSPAHWYFNRYLAGPILLTMIYALAEAAPFFARRAWRRAGGIAALAIGVCLLVQWRCFAGLRWSEAPTGGFLASWRNIGAHVDPGARMGAFQAGIYGYFGGREVVNLDGKVNQDAWAALRDNRLHEYIRAQGVRYILDRDWMIDALVARHAPPGRFSYRAVSIGSHTGGVRLYEVRHGD